MSKLLSLLAVLVCFATLSYAQSKQYTGKVVDKDKQPVPNASIVIKGSDVATVADSDGNFKITAKPGDVLVVSAISFTPITLKVQNQANLTVSLSSTDKVMEEVIVTAGGIKSKRKEIGTATTTIKAESLVAGKSVSVAGGLQGKVAGLQINATGGGVNPNYRLILRGQRSLTGNNQALVVLDNVIVPNDILGNLNPEDVEDVVVLNGSGAAALYGSQASNGAVVITTKKGKKGVISVGLSNTVTVQEVAFYPKIQKKYGAGGSTYGTDANGKPFFSYLENQSYGPEFDGTKRPLGDFLEDGSQDSAIYAYNPGHFDFWEKGVTNQTDFSLSAGDDVSTFYLSGQYASVTGTTPGDKFNRSSLRVNGTRKVGKNIMATYAVAYIQNRYDITTQTGSMYANMLNMPSNVDITKYKNWRTDKFANPNGFYNPWYQNPYFSADNYRSKQRNDYLTGSLEIKYSPLKNLDIVARQGVVTRNYSNKNTVGEFLYTEYAKHTDQSSKADIPGSVSDGSSYTTQLLSDVFAQYTHEVGEFDFKLIGGGQWRQDEAKFVNVGASGLVIPGLYNVSYGVGTPDASESNFKARQIGMYGDFRVGFRNYLFLHGTLRNDWVSILNSNNRSFMYPSVDVSFVASDALDFIKSSEAISYLKLRAGWSKVGQVNLGGNFGAYSLVPTYSSNANGFPYGTLAGYTVDNTLVAPELKPELTGSYEFGFELNLFKDRFTSNVTWYDSKTDDQTVNTRISSASGFSGLRTNTGQTQSRGLEATAHYTPIKTNDFTVTVGGNYTYLDNKVNFINADLPRLALATYGADGPGSYAVAGQTFPVIMGFDYKRDAGGRVIVDRLTGLPTKSDTISILGNSAYKNRLSLDASVTYKNFTFSMLWEYRGGAQVYNAMGSELDWAGTGYRTAIYNRERFVFPNSVVEDPAKPGSYIPNTEYMVRTPNGNAGFWSDGINRDVSSNYVTSADFWKLRELAVTYSVPANIVRKIRGFKGINISVQARNLLLFMARDNYYTDPEYSDAGNDSNGIGLTGLGQTPPSRYYGATLSFKF
ncbi:SusC/RagA family TonB-linked outer membrane protein [Paraflavitalea sp. CAU 1676]|uniref:SusC/RagA family TonB-linked outer membrane protein n=1 Tax=Paraflavitalea sp. CAU 1676 TaxID=3032598 RepID=UPI0023DA0DBB|nr:SusC/RagA family TonB-linked outer membrane protein [Paraflavitalea sp. CAU 1676]MDF2192247.1 SusC/RagA family TonB-linked outer membrane protein [Paraflavitalea sp. CAU 1676]